MRKKIKTAFLTWDNCVRQLCNCNITFKHIALSNIIMYWIMAVWFCLIVMNFERYSHTLYFRKLSGNVDAFYYTTKTVSVSVFTDFSQSSLFSMWNGNPLKRGRSFYNPPIGHLHDDPILLLRPETFRVLLSCAN